MSATSDRCDAIVGIRLLNVDHREIEGLIDELHATVASGDKYRIIRILRKLSGFTRTHFALEEGMMSATEYPSLAAHRRCHQSLLLQLDSFISLYLKGRLTLSPGSLSFLLVWYAAHSHNDDAQYADWLVIRDACLSHKEPSMLPPGAGSMLA
jgi:hemerythrin